MELSYADYTRCLSRKLVAVLYLLLLGSRFTSLLEPHGVNRRDVGHKAIITLEDVDRLHVILFFGVVVVAEDDVSNDCVLVCSFVGDICFACLDDLPGGGNSPQWIGI